MLEQPFQGSARKEEPEFTPEAGGLALEGIRDAYRIKRFRLEEIRDKISDVATMEESERPPLNALLFTEREIAEEIKNMEEQFDSLGGDADELRTMEIIDRRKKKRPGA